jgi:hypothetical protein
MSSQQKNTDVKLPKRLSPELAEVLHMLKSLEAQPAPKIDQVNLRS